MVRSLALSIVLLAGAVPGAAQEDPPRAVHDRARELLAAGAYAEFLALFDSPAREALVVEAFLAASAGGDEQVLAAVGRHGVRREDLEREGLRVLRSVDDPAALFEDVCRVLEARGAPPVFPEVAGPIGAVRVEGDRAWTENEPVVRFRRVGGAWLIARRFPEDHAEGGPSPVAVFERANRALEAGRFDVFYRCLLPALRVEWAAEALVAAAASPAPDLDRSLEAFGLTAEATVSREAARAALAGRDDDALRELFVSLRRRHAVGAGPWRNARVDARRDLGDVATIEIEFEEADGTPARRTFHFVQEGEGEWFLRLRPRR